jgi:hypothetical protein
MKNKIPNLSNVSSQTLAKKSILLNNQRILFDKKVTLMPVIIEKKTKYNDRF